MRKRWTKKSEKGPSVDEKRSRFSYEEFSDWFFWWVSHDFEMTICWWTTVAMKNQDIFIDRGFLRSILIIYKWAIYSMAVFKQHISCKFDGRCPHQLDRRWIVYWKWLKCEVLLYYTYILYCLSYIYIYIDIQLIFIEMYYVLFIIYIYICIHNDMHDSHNTKWYTMIHDSLKYHVHWWHWCSVALCNVYRMNI